MKGASACPAAAEKWETGGSGGLQEAGGVCPQQVSWGEVWGTTWREAEGGYTEEVSPQGKARPEGGARLAGQCPDLGLDAASRPQHQQSL